MYYILYKYRIHAHTHTHILEDLEMRSSWISCVGLKSKHGCHYKNESEIDYTDSGRKDIEEKMI